MPVLHEPKLKRVFLTRFPESDPAWVDIIESSTVGEAELLEDMGLDRSTKRSTLILMTVTAMIKDWNFQDSEGNTLPITLDNVRRLEFQDLEEIQAASESDTGLVEQSQQKKTDSSPTSKQNKIS